jgi:hypothetical protein
MRWHEERRRRALGHWADTLVAIETARTTKRLLQSMSCSIAQNPEPKSPSSRFH